ncbi:MAG: lytic transglycosylase domain-containing protein [Gallionellaceae bacterium]|nr:lytic transglycosylase domain-containing protein [Gallionellaceae bacterium]
MYQCSRFYLCLIGLASLAGAAGAECWYDAAAAYGLNPLELGAIACVESRLNSNAISPVGARGVMQVMPSNARAVGMHPDLLWDACTNIYMGAYVLAEMKAKYGDSWEAVGAYNAACTKLKGAACRKARTEYAWAVYRARVNLERTGKCS